MVDLRHGQTRTLRIIASNHNHRAASETDAHPRPGTGLREDGPFANFLGVHIQGPVWPGSDPRRSPDPRSRSIAGGYQNLRDPDPRTPLTVLRTAASQKIKVANTPGNLFFNPKNLSHIRIKPDDPGQGDQGHACRGIDLDALRDAPKTRILIDVGIPDRDFAGVPVERLGQCESHRHGCCVIFPLTDPAVVRGVDPHIQKVR